MTQSSRPNVVDIVGLSGLCLLLFFAGLGSYHLWDVDEGMHARIARLMLDTGDWVTPYFNGEPFFDKPPLFNWLNALAFWLFGFTEFAARLVPALATLGTVLATYLLGRNLYGRTTGLLAGLILASSLEVLMLSRAVVYDSLLLFLLTSALCCFVVATSGDPSRRKLTLVGLYTALGLSVLVKGLVGIAIVGLFVVLYVLFVGGRATLGRLAIPLGLVLVLAIAAPWYLLMERANNGFLYDFVVRQHLANFLGDAVDFEATHPQPVYYYLLILLAGLFPWSLQLVGGLRRALRGDAGRTDRIDRWLGWSLLGVLAVFTLATSKQPTYMLPVFPIAALLVGRYWLGVIRATEPAHRRALLLWLGGAVALFLLLFVIALNGDYRAAWSVRYGLVSSELLICVAIPVVFLGAAWIFVFLDRRRAAFACLVCVSPTIILYFVHNIAPDMNPYRGTKQLAQELTAVLPPGEPLYMYEQLFDSAMFYADRDAVELMTESELDDYLAADERVFVLVRDRAGPGEARFAGPYHVIEIAGNRAIVSNQPGPLSSAGTRKPSDQRTATPNHP